MAENYYGSPTPPYAGNTWIPEDAENVPVILKEMRTSAVEAFARRIDLPHNNKWIPLGDDFQVQHVERGGLYTETTASHYRVDITAEKFGGYKIFNDEDLNDLRDGIDPLQTSRAMATRNLALTYSNACLGTSGTRVISGGDANDRPFVSVYSAVKLGDATNLFDASNYTAGANYFTIAQTGTTTAQKLAAFNDVLYAYETSDWHDQQALAIAHPRFRHFFRGMLDANDRPLVTDRVLEQYDGQLYGYNLKYDYGARVSNFMSNTPSGNPLLILASPQFICKGVASLAPGIPADQPGFNFQASTTGLGFLRDQAYMKAGLRRGFRLLTANAAIVVELLP